MKSSHASTESPAVAATTAYASEPDLQIEETDIRVLSTYVDEGWGSDGMTLVGLGPPSSRSPVVLSEPDDTGKKTVRSEPPGPWGSDDEEPLPRSLRRRTGGIWGAVIPLFLVFTAIVVFVLRGLAPSPRAHAPAAAPAVEQPARESAGVFVKLTNPAVLVAVDGVIRGAPPVLLMYLDPGSHVVSIAGPGYARYEQTVTLVAGNVSTLEPVLESETIDLDTVNVAEGSHGASAASSATRAHAPGPMSLAERLARASGAVKPVPVVLEETPDNPYPGLLAASSTPSAMLVVDGRPLGQSPRAVDLPPGIHTLVFVHPELGRKSMTVSIRPGKTTNVAVDF